MKFKQPKRTILEPDEVDRVNHIRMAKWYQIDPRLINELPEDVYQDTLEIMWFEDMIAKDNAQKQKAAQARARARKRR